MSKLNPPEVPAGHHIDETIISNDKNAIQCVFWYGGEKYARSYFPDSGREMEVVDKIVSGFRMKLEEVVLGIQRETD